MEGLGARLVVTNIPPPYHHTQGVMMGWLTAAGSLARSLGPIFVSFLYHQFGPLVTFSAVDGIVAVSILLLFVSRYRLVPYPDDY